MSNTRRHAVAEFLSRYETLCEVGIGRRPEVAATLAERGCTVTVTDVHDHEDSVRTVSAEVEFVPDDVVEASRQSDPEEHYHADAVYGLNLPPELHRPTATVARRVDADCLFTTLGGDPPAVETRPISLDGGETLYVARGERVSASDGDRAESERT